MEDPFTHIEPQGQAGDPESGGEIAQRGSLGLSLIIIGVLLALFVPILGPIIALIMGIVIRKTPGAIALIVLGGFFISVHLVFNILVPLFTTP